MPAAQNLIGKQFGCLQVLELDKEKTIAKKRRYWICSCLECGQKHSIRADIIKKNQHCPINAHKGVNIKNEINNVYGKLKVIGQDINRTNANGDAFWICKCECGTVCSVNGIDLRRKHTRSCGCTHSRGESKIINILETNNIKYIKEKTFDSCRFPDTNALAKFDFYLPDYNILIEYNGEQHYSSKESGWNTLKSFEQTQKRDEYKKQWCVNNNIILIIIPYTDYELFTIDTLIGNEDKYIYEK